MSEALARSGEAEDDEEVAATARLHWWTARRAPTVSRQMASMTSRLPSLGSTPPARSASTRSYTVRGSGTSTSTVDPPSASGCTASVPNSPPSRAAGLSPAAIRLRQTLPFRVYLSGLQFQRCR